MKKIIASILIGLFLLIGCEPQPSSKPRPVAAQDVVQEQTNEQSAQTEPQIQAVEPENLTEFEITMKILTVDKTDYPAVDGIWESVTRGYVTADLSEILSETQLEIGMAWPDFDEKLNAIKQNIDSISQSEITVSAHELKPVYLKVGDKISSEKFFYYGRWYRAENFNFESAERILKIVPRKVPGREFINLLITIVFSDLLPDGGKMEFVQMTAGITLMPMQPAVIGIPVEADDYLGKALLISKDSDKDKQSLIVLTIKPATSD
ncbi:MAG: hypothetical protein WCZ89_04125 [Phycisphaerae bacterium]